MPASIDPADRKLLLIGGAILLVLTAGLAFVGADSLEAPTREEREALQRFVDEGGQVLFTGARIKSFFPEAKVDTEMPTVEWKTFSADLPSNYTFGAPKIVLQ